MSIPESYLKSYKFKLDLISILPIVPGYHSYQWPNTNLSSNALRILDCMWLLKLLRIKNTGYALQDGFSKEIIKRYYKQRLDQLIEDKRNEE